MTADLPADDAEHALRVQLASTARWLHRRGWTPATSGNFSAAVPGGFLISASGIDKEGFTPADMMKVDLEGRLAPGERRRASAETLLHATVYRLMQAGAVLHTHAPAATALSLAASGKVTLSGYELLKAFCGITTHATTLEVPVFPNSQDLLQLSALVGDWLGTTRQQGRPAHGLLLAGHGLYAWGSTVEEARRHLEAFEFLFECELRRAGRKS